MRSMDTPTGANRDNGGEIAVFLFLLCYALLKLHLMHPLFEKAAGLTKAVEKILPIHKAQLLSYLKLLDIPIGLLINFHERKVTDGVSRLILPGANR